MKFRRGAPSGADVSSLMWDQFWIGVRLLAETNKPRWKSQSSREGAPVFHEKALGATFKKMDTDLCGFVDQISLVGNGAIATLVRIPQSRPAPSTQQATS